MVFTMHFGYKKESLFHYQIQTALTYLLRILMQSGLHCEELVTKNALH